MSKTALWVEVDCEERSCGGCDCRYYFEGEHECGAFDVALGKYDDGLPNRYSDCLAAASRAAAMMRVVEAVRADFGEYTGKATIAALAALDGLEKK